MRELQLVEVTRLDFLVTFRSNIMNHLKQFKDSTTQSTFTPLIECDKSRCCDLNFECVFSHVIGRGRERGILGKCVSGAENYHQL